MVQSDDLRQLLRKRPFQPFRVHLTDGRVFEVRYPNINLLGMTFFDIGIPTPNQEDPFPERMVMVLLDMIERVEPLTEAVPLTSK
jgi:hypothetical protein